jgi:hypothetical protein
MGFFGGGGSSVDLASPPAIGSTTPNTGAFTSLTVKASTGLSDRSITGSGTTSGLSIESSNTYILTANQYATRFGRGGDLGVTIRSDSAFGITSGSADATIDTILRRDAANTFAQRRSTNAQTFRLYRTFTDASNYERLGFLATNTTRYTITSENAGTGSARSLEVSFYTSASDPTSTDITDGCFSVWKNSGTGTIKLWANDGGTMKSVALA